VGLIVGAACGRSAATPTRVARSLRTRPRARRPCRDAATASRPRAFEDGRPKSNAVDERAQEGSAPRDANSAEEHAVGRAAHRSPAGRAAHRRSRRQSMGALDEATASGTPRSEAWRHRGLEETSASLRADLERTRSAPSRNAIGGGDRTRVPDAASAGRTGRASFLRGSVLGWSCRCVGARVLSGCPGGGALDRAGPLPIAPAGPTSRAAPHPTGAIPPTFRKGAARRLRPPSSKRMLRTPNVTASAILRLQRHQAAVARRRLGSRPSAKRLGIAANATEPAPRLQGSQKIVFDADAPQHRSLGRVGGCRGGGCVGCWGGFGDPFFRCASWSISRSGTRRRAGRRWSWSLCVLRRRCPSAGRVAGRSGAPSSSTRLRTRSELRPPWLQALWVFSRSLGCGRVSAGLACGRLGLSFGVGCLVCVTIRIVCWC